MRDRKEKVYETECCTCSRISALKIKAEVLQRFIVTILPPTTLRTQTEVELTSRQLAATKWQLAIAACLRHEMAPHPRCASCGILMGPGHLELGIEGMCGTCRYSRTTNGTATNAAHSRPVIGKRGWLSDYAVK